MTQKLPNMGNNNIPGRGKKKLKIPLTKLQTSTTKILLLLVVISAMCWCCRWQLEDVALATSRREQ